MRTLHTDLRANHAGFFRSTSLCALRVRKKKADPPSVLRRGRIGVTLRLDYAPLNLVKTGMTGAWIGLIRR